MDCRVFAPRKEPLLLSAVNDSVVRISPPSRWNGAPTTVRKHRCSLMGVLFCLGRRTEGVQEASGKPPASINVRQLGRKQFPAGADAPTTARTVGLPPRRGKYFLSKRKKVPKKASGTATPEAARPAARYSQISAFRALPCPALVFAQACQSLTAYGSCAHWARAPSRPKLRSAGAERLDAPNLFGASNSGR